MPGIKRCRGMYEQQLAVDSVARRYEMTIPKGHEDVDSHCSHILRLNYDLINESNSKRSLQELQRDAKKKKKGRIRNTRAQHS